MDPNHLQDVGVFLDQVRQVSATLSPARARAVACAIARRHLAVLGGDAGVVPSLVARVLEHGGLPASEVERLEAVFDALHAGIDPDRVDAMDRRRALGVLHLALASCAEADARPRVLDVIRAALASRALRTPARTDAERVTELEDLGRRWAWEAVRDEARWLAAELAAV